ncbi:hypothetical protein GQ55_7G196100 [Panicum hallii var. hallii]|uniref:Uncharacterized protein n=1 Tax=Panicum hallii var. hallii TaxID=1504633 RepID=A0A2T7CX72_9POAL|nr:hypothetical protein GQ55_7G196100 [Panicum hallii var. hallii]
MQASRQLLTAVTAPPTVRPRPRRSRRGTRALGNPWGWGRIRRGSAHVRPHLFFTPCTGTVSCFPARNNHLGASLSFPFLSFPFSPRAIILPRSRAPPRAGGAVLPHHRWRSPGRAFCAAPFRCSAAQPRTAVGTSDMLARMRWIGLDTDWAWFQIGCGVHSHATASPRPDRDCRCRCQLCLARFYYRVWVDRAAVAGSSNYHLSAMASWQESVPAAACHARLRLRASLRRPRVLFMPS